MPDGSAWLRDERCGEPAAAEALGEAVAQRMMRAGAEELLRASEQLAVGA